MPERRLGKTKARGYGGSHKRMRAYYARQVAAGTAVCWRCELPIDPDEPWDAGHDDDDRRVYAGPEHRKCNRGAAGKKGASLPPAPRYSRDW